MCSSGTVALHLCCCYQAHSFAIALMQVDAGIDAVGFEARGCGHSSHVERPAQVRQGMHLNSCSTVELATSCFRFLLRSFVWLVNRSTSCNDVGPANASTHKPNQ